MFSPSAIAGWFEANCGCGDSNCTNCCLFFPVANCGDSNCTSCVCLIPTAKDAAIMLIVAEGVLVALHAVAGEIVASAIVTK